MIDSLFFYEKAGTYVVDRQSLRWVYAEPVSTSQGPSGEWVVTFGFKEGDSWAIRELTEEQAREIVQVVHVKERPIGFRGTVGRVEEESETLDS